VTQAHLTGASGDGARPCSAVAVAAELNETDFQQQRRC